MAIFGMVSTADSREYTRHALRTFFATTSLAEDDVFVLIDNDKRVDPDLVAPYPRLSLLVNPTPRGFSANVNQLIPRALAARCPLFFLNNDVIFTPHWLDPLLVPEPAILSPLSNREVQYAASVVVPRNQNVRSMLLCEMRMDLEQYIEHEKAFDYIADTHRRTVNGYWATYILPYFAVKLPYPVLEVVGLFDEAFGLGGGEDYDYSIRAALAGFDTKFALGSYLLHFGGRSSYAAPGMSERFQEQERHFKRVFGEKWGADLHDLCLLERTKVLEEFQGSTPGERLPREILAALAAGRAQPIKISAE